MAHGQGYQRKSRPRKPSAPVPRPPRRTLLSSRAYCPSAPRCVRCQSQAKNETFLPSQYDGAQARALHGQPVPGSYGVDLLGPFLGVGGILLEASLLGCQVVGVDALRRMTRGSRRNLKHFGMDPLGLVRGDARFLPIRDVKAIATDPPYGTGASTLKSTTRNILKDFLPNAHSILSKGCKAVVAS